jgi:hypothetical protein
LVKDTLETEQDEQEGELKELLKCLDQADVDPALADFMEEDEVTQIMVHQLLDTIDDLKGELEKEKKARRDADTRLIRATHKRPNPQSPLADDGEGSRQIKWLRSVEEKRVMATPTPNTSVPATEPLPDVGPVDPTPQPPSDANDAPP